MVAGRAPAGDRKETLARGSPERAAKGQGAKR
jgi:hypothetical protein